MSDDALIRRENLKRLGKTPGDLAAAVGGRYSYWRDLLEDPKKSFGEKIARKIEEKLDLPRLWLDGGTSKLRSITKSPSSRTPDPLDVLGTFLRNIPETNRKAIGALLAEWALAPDLDHWKDAVRALQVTKGNRVG